MSASSTCIACANGTDALLLPLLASGIGPGDAVFVPSFTFAATAEVVALAKAEPVFVDIDPDTYNIDVASLEAAIDMIRAEGRLDAARHHPGRPVRASPPTTRPSPRSRSAKASWSSRMPRRPSAARPADACAAPSATVASTSFYPAKPLGCYGDGGAMFTNDDAFADKLRSFAFHGKGETQYDNVHVGLNSRLDTIQAAILIEKLAILEDEMEARRRVGAALCRGSRRCRQDGARRRPAAARPGRNMPSRRRTATR